MIIDICFNILTREALTGNINAMYDLISTSFTPTKEEVRHAKYLLGVIKDVA